MARWSSTQAGACSERVRPRLHCPVRSCGRRAAAAAPLSGSWASAALATQEKGPYRQHRCQEQASSRPQRASAVPSRRPPGAAGFNRVVQAHDPTAHAEVEAIRAAAASLGRPHLLGCTLYSSAEPCPMCYAASQWARIERIYYGATYADVQRLGGFEDGDFLEQLRRPPAERTPAALPLLRDEALVPWGKYAAMPGRVPY